MCVFFYKKYIISLPMTIKIVSSRVEILKLKKVFYKQSDNIAH